MNQLITPLDMKKLPHTFTPLYMPIFYLLLPYTHSLSILLPLLLRMWMHVAVNLEMEAYWLDPSSALAPFFPENQIFQQAARILHSTVG